MGGDSRGPRDYHQKSSDKDSYRRSAPGGPDKTAEAGAGAGNMEFVSYYSSEVL